MPRFAVARTTTVLDPVDWISFRSRFVSPGGRVIDNGNGGVSHSEGQGWGMLFATAFDDRATFDAIQGWTARTLRRPNDALHAWRYIPNGKPPVSDLNNATDGDLFIAAALARAGTRWGVAAYLQSAAAIARDILTLLVRVVGGRALLLPAINGFESDEAIILNPSYYALPMLAELSQIVPSAQWAHIVGDGRNMIARGRFGQWRLPPDWLRVSQPSLELSPAPGWPPRFSFDAIRVPLWSTWAKRPVGDTRTSMVNFLTSYPAGAMPAWADLLTNEMAPYPLTPGMAAVERLTVAAVNGGAPDLPAVAAASKYYDAALILLCHLARQEIHAG